MKKTIILTILILKFSFLMYAQSGYINVGVYSSDSITSMVMRADTGKYEIVADKKFLLKLKKGRAVHLEIMNDLIKITTENEEFGPYKMVEFKGLGYDNKLKIVPTQNDLSERIYYDNISVSAKNQKFVIVNNILLQHYIAGVVSSEIGTNNDMETFKTQAVLARTYALRRIDKHFAEGFQVCDGVHCQAYKGDKTVTPSIRLAVNETMGLVVVDTRNALIDAVYHANSGGQTANSEDVWQEATPYLRSVDDQYSVGQRQTNWEVTDITVDEWKEYLLKNSFKYVSDTLRAEHFKFQQNSRQEYYYFGGDSLRLTQIRKDFGLRSTFFSIEANRNNLIFKGRGYGHGVGMSQEGAMNMAASGFTYDQIISFYYQGVKISSVKEINNLKQFYFEEGKRGFFKRKFNKR